MSRKPVLHCAFAFGLALLSISRVRAAVIPDENQALPPAGLAQAYFLEHHSHDYPAARKAYQAALEQASTREDAAAARAGLARCRDHLIAQDFASVMPPDAMAYVEFQRPGEIARALSAMLGLNDKSIDEALAARPSAQSSVPFHVPGEIVISPAIFDVLGKFGGFAVALTDIDFEGDRPPAGVLIIHHGDVTLLKGLLETLFQFAPTAEKIRDLPTFGVRIPDAGQIVGVLTESLLIVGSERGLVDGVVGRVMGEKTASLASNEESRSAFRTRSEGTFFAFADLERMLAAAKKSMHPRDRDDFARINAFADLESLRWATISAGVEQGVLGAEVVVKLAEDHHSLIYNFMRLTPMSREGLSYVPADSAVVIGVGLNPSSRNVTAETGRAETAPVISGFDIGREFFANIHEISAFVVPGAITTATIDRERIPIPNLGIVLTVNDAARSRALWNELLKLPGMLNEDEPITPKAIEIAGTSATAYTMPELGEVYLAEVDGCVAFGLTRNALKSMILARREKNSILDDGALGGVIEKLPKDTSLFAVGHVGRIAQCATGLNDMEVAMVANPAAHLCRDTIAWAAVSQSPSRFSLSLALTGLPKINDALRQFSPLIQAATSSMEQPAPRHSRKHRRRDDRRREGRDENAGNKNEKARL